MEVETLKEYLIKYNSPSYRIRILESIVCSLLPDELMSHDDKRKVYYDCMAAYYSVDHSNPNIIEERVEHNLVVAVEAAFVDAMHQRELTEPEKEHLRSERFLKKTKYEQMMGNFKDDNWIGYFK
jgi:hypothetical protein